jgi:hypothetical protein
MAGLKRITDLLAASTLLGDELLEVSQVSTTVVKTGTTLSAQASDNSYNDSAAGFVAAGFAVGDRVRVTGFTGNVANNIVVGVVTAVTTTKLTIGGTDGNVIVDDAAGESVTIAKWVSRRALLSDIGIGGGGGSGAYDMRFGFSATPTGSQVIDTVMVTRDLILPANMVGSLGQVGVNPTSTFVMDLEDDGTGIGTISVSTSGVFTFATSGGVDINIALGSVLTLVAPTTPDATVEDMTMTLLIEQDL